MKTCTKCGEKKQLDCFHMRPDTIDGHRGECKDCGKAYHREREKLPLSPHQRKLRTEHDKIRRLLYPLRIKANNAVNTAIKYGRLTRPDKCQDCGAEGIIHGHHKDYTKPFEVDWLCRVCHIARHTKTA